MVQLARLLRRGISSLLKGEGWGEGENEDRPPPSNSLPLGEGELEARWGSGEVKASRYSGLIL